MADGWKPIERIQEGGISLVSATRANELIDAVNALMGARIVPIAGFGKMMAAGGQVVYDFTAADGRFTVSGNVQEQIDAINNRLDNATINGEGTCMGNNIAINISLNI